MTKSIMRRVVGLLCAGALCSLGACASGALDDATGRAKGFERESSTFTPSTTALESIAWIGRADGTGCFGVLVTDTIVATPASCVNGDAIGDLTARTLHVDVILEIEELVVHPSYDPDTVVANDVAYLRVGETEVHGVERAEVGLDGVSRGRAVYSVYFEGESFEGSEPRTAKLVTSAARQTNFTARRAAGNDGTGMLGAPIFTTVDEAEVLVGMIVNSDASVVDALRFARFADFFAEEPVEEEEPIDETPTTSPDDCTTLGFFGRCDGSTLVWCNEGATTASRYDCASDGQQCRILNAQFGNACMDRPAAGDPCAGEWSCGGGACINRARLCDGTPECGDGSDEAVESCTPQSVE